MRQKKGEGTKIAQAAKELGVTSVTIRRYITEFNIETSTDENGIKVLPGQAMEELQEIRKLKEDGLTNPKVLEILEESRAKASEKAKAKDKGETGKRVVARRAQEAAPAAAKRKAAVKEPEPEPAPEVEEEPVQETEEEEREREAEVEEPVAEQKVFEEEHGDEEKEEPPVAITTADGKSKYSLVCQTCQKTFEHMNPRLRDCLDCYRIKRKERRRGGDKHKNVIQNPIAQQVLNKNQQIAQQQLSEEDLSAPVVEPERTERPERPERPVVAARVAVEPKRVSVREQLNFSPVSTTPSVYQRAQVRSYRKAIEETRSITSNLKRRLERPDLPEAERRFLEQIYAYQLILHQGWKHLSEYRQADSGSGSSKHDS